MKVWFINKSLSTYEIEYILSEDNVRYVRMKLVRNDIKYWSKNKEDLEIKLDAKKYNL